MNRHSRQGDASGAAARGVARAAAVASPSGARPSCAGVTRRKPRASVAMITIIARPISIAACAKPSRPMVATQSGDRMTPPTLAPL